MPGAAPVCHPERRGGVGRAGGGIREHAEDGAGPAGALALQHQRSGGVRGRGPGGHPRPPM